MNAEHVIPSPWRAYLPAVLSFILLIGGISIDQLAPQFWQQPWWRFVWYLAAYLPVGWPVLVSAVRAIGKGDVFSEFFLMSLATIGAFYIGEYPEGVAVMLFYAVGELFQDAAINRAKRNIQALLDVRRDTANVMRDGVPVETPAAEVKVGDIIRIRGVGVGDRVAMLATTELEAVVLFMSTMRLGATLVPINFRLAAAEIEHVLEDSSPILLIAQESFSSTLALVSPKAMT